MPIGAPAAAAALLATLGGLKIGGAALNKKVQKQNIKGGKPQGALSEALFGMQPGRLNESLEGLPENNGSGQVQQFQNFTPEQRQIMNSLSNLGHTGVQDLINRQNEGIEPVIAQARRGFHQETIPTIAERFSAIGGQRSSAFPKQLGTAAADLESNLASLRANYGLQQQGLQQNLYGNLLGLGLRPQYENAFLGGDVNSGPGGAINNLNPSYQDVLGFLNSLGYGDSGQANNSTVNQVASAAAPVAGALAGGAAAGNAAVPAAAGGGFLSTGLGAGLAGAGIMAASAIPFLAARGIIKQVDKGKSHTIVRKDDNGNVVSTAYSNQQWPDGSYVEVDNQGNVIPPKKASSSIRQTINAAKTLRDPNASRADKQAALNIIYPKGAPQSVQDQVFGNAAQEQPVAVDDNVAAQPQLAQMTLRQAERILDDPRVQNAARIINEGTASSEEIAQAEQAMNDPLIGRAIEVFRASGEPEAAAPESNTSTNALIDLFNSQYPPKQAAEQEFTPEQEAAIAEYAANPEGKSRLQRIMDRVGLGDYFASAPQAPRSGPRVTVVPAAPSNPKSDKKKLTKAEQMKKHAEAKAKAKARSEERKKHMRSARIPRD